MAKDDDAEILRDSSGSRQFVGRRRDVPIAKVCRGYAKVILSRDGAGRVGRRMLASRTHDSYTKRSSAPNGILPNSLPNDRQPSGKHQPAIELPACVLPVVLLVLLPLVLFVFTPTSSDRIPWHLFPAGRGWSTSFVLGAFILGASVGSLSETKFSERTMFSKGTILRRSYQVVVPAKRSCTRQSNPGRGDRRAKAVHCTVDSGLHIHRRLHIRRNGSHAARDSHARGHLARGHLAVGPLRLVRPFAIQDAAILATVPSANGNRRVSGHVPAGQGLSRGVIAAVRPLLPIEVILVA